MPTKKEKLFYLETSYREEKRQIKDYFTTALLMDDSDTQAELKEELAELEKWYAEEKENLD